MATSIRISRMEDRETKLSGLMYLHDDCSKTEMRCSRDLTTENYVLECQCGFRVEFEPYGDVAGQILKTATDGQLRILSDDGYTAKVVGRIEIHGGSKDA